MASGLCIECAVCGGTTMGEDLAELEICDHCGAETDLSTLGEWDDGDEGDGDPDDDVIECAGCGSAVFADEATEDDLCRFCAEDEAG